MKIIEISRDKDVILCPDAILDISAGRLAENKWILIRNGRIRAILSPAETNRLTEGMGSELISLPDVTLIPGLIDCHVHFALDGVNFHQALERWGERPALDTHLIRCSANFLAHGITAVRDGGDKPCIGLGTRNRILDGEFTGPKVAASGFAIRREGYYGSFLGPGIRDLRDGEERIHELAELGVDQIKIVVSGIVSFKEFGKVGPLQYTQPELSALVAESHRLGLKVMAHASSDECVRAAAMAGVDSVEHGYFLSDRSLEIMADKGTAWVPTLVPLVLLTEEPWRSSRSSEEIEVLEKTFRPHMEKIRQAEAMGVTLGIGTDAGAIGVKHGRAYYDEIRLFREAGLSKISCLRAATSQAASIIGCENEMGNIAPGMSPRLTGVRGNPLEDLEVLRDPVCLVLPEQK